jgi:hypothetical protein
MQSPFIPGVRGDTQRVPGLPEYFFLAVVVRLRCTATARKKFARDVVPHAPYVATAMHHRATGTLCIYVVA